MEETFRKRSGNVGNPVVAWTPLSHNKKCTRSVDMDKDDDIEELGEEAIEEEDEEAWDADAAGASASDLDPDPGSDSDSAV